MGPWGIPSPLAKEFCAQPPSELFFVVRMEMALALLFFVHGRCVFCFFLEFDHGEGRGSKEERDPGYVQTIG